MTAPFARHKRHRVWMVPTSGSGNAAPWRVARVTEAQLIEWFHRQPQTGDALAADAYRRALEDLVDVLTSDLLGAELYAAIEVQVANAREVLDDPNPVPTVDPEAVAA